MFLDHAQAIAEALALKNYETDFSQLPASCQELLFNKAQRQANMEIAELARES